jgi:hypothetical protein
MCKKWVWDWGLRVPLIIRFPERYRHFAPGSAGSSTDRLVSFVDFAPTLLSLVGVKVPPHMQGRAFLGPQAGPPREYAFAIRDRMAEWHDVVRVVRNNQYQYHRNFMPHLAWAPFTSYTLRMPTAQIAARLHEQGKLDPAQDRFFRPKPTEELYDLAADPHMLHNLADDPDHATIVARMRRALRQWQLRTRDLGLMSEYEMHGRSRGSTQFETGQREDRYPLMRILPVAELASQRDPKNLPQLVGFLGDEEPIIRWWAATGLVMLGDDAGEAQAALEERLRDTSPLVRIAAAEAIYHGGHADRALAVLRDALQDDTPFVRLRALTCLYRMGDAARPALPAIEQASIQGIYPAEYANRMVEYLPKRWGQ